MVRVRIPRMLMVRVRGESMLPRVRAGDIILCVDRPGVEVGSVVIVPAPTESGWSKPTKRCSVMIKRIASVGHGEVDLRGDNKARSWDSQTLGPCPSAYILGTAVFVIRHGIPRPVPRIIPHRSHG